MFTIEGQFVRERADKRFSKADITLSLMILGIEFHVETSS